MTQAYKEKEIIYDLPSEEYHSQKDSFSSSQVKDALYSISKFHAKYIAGTEEKMHIPAFDIGTYFHTGVLEPHLLDKECAVYPGLIRNGKEWESFKAENAGKAIVTKKEKLVAENLIKGVQLSPRAMDLIKRGTPEVSAYIVLDVFEDQIWCGDYNLQAAGWVYKPNRFKKDCIQIKVKARSDILGDTNYILDLKSFSGDPEDVEVIAGKVENLHYILSAAFYCDIFTMALDRKIDYFIWTFASKSEKDKDSGVAKVKNYVATRSHLMCGRAMWSTAVKRIAHSMRNNWSDIDDELVLLPATPKALMWGHQWNDKLFINGAELIEASKEYQAEDLL